MIVIIINNCTMFNPDLLKNMNPEQLKNINPEMVKTASDRISSMSNQQIKATLKMAGMNNIDPEMLKKSSEYMKNMNNEDLQRMKNMMQTQAPGNQPVNDHKFKDIVEIKNLGNQLFKKQKYEQAADLYLDALSKIDEQNPVQAKDKTELKNLENTIRLNYAINQSKRGNFEVVKRQTKKILSSNQNPKASFRLAEAQFHTEEYKQALKNVQIALKGIPGDDIIKKLKFKIEAKLKQLKNKKNQKISESIIESKQEQKKQPKYSNQQNERKQEKLIIQQKLIRQEQKQIKKQQYEDVIIEQERQGTQQPTSTIEQLQQNSNKQPNQPQSTSIQQKSISLKQSLSIQYIVKYYKENYPLVILVLLIFVLDHLLF